MLSADNIALFLTLGFQLVIIPEALENDPFRVCTARLSEASLKTSKQTIRKSSIRQKATQIRVRSQHAAFPIEYKNRGLLVISWRDKKPKQQKMLLVILMVTSKLKKRIRKDMIQVKRHLRKHSDSFSWV